MPEKIKVSEKALAHLSRGLYRSPASALRELVSNAWDANATDVRIDTNHPIFSQLSIEDNGNGFTLDEFKRIMDGGIGDSQKRPATTPLIHNRPVIGRLGVGMLGIAQICGAFTIASKTRDGNGFKARIHLYDLLQDRIDEGDTTVIGTDEIDVGEYEIIKYDNSIVKNGTRIIADDVHPTFTRTFRESLEFEAYKAPPIGNWSKLIKIVSSVHSIQELGDYWRFIWELATACPIPYIDSRALPNGLIKAEQGELLKYDFNVSIDGIQLYKPVKLVGNKGGYTAVKLVPTVHTVYGKRLSFHGYLVVQEGEQLKPDELRGILTRIKNVGIGYYDQSLLDYRYNEGPRSRWVTGEIFVDEGLENALNIDRDSFNKFHPEYRRVQEEIHKVLKNDIFPSSYQKITIRSDERSKQKSAQRKRDLQATLEEVTEKRVKVSSSRAGAASPEVKVHATKDELDIVLPNSKDLKIKKSHQDLAAAILSLFELAVREQDSNKRKQLFSELLLTLLKRW